ncbi:MAG: hypothetical protein ACQGVK_25440 [Myxococcota bacterium]
MKPSISLSLAIVFCTAVAFLAVEPRSAEPAQAQELEESTGSTAPASTRRIASEVAQLELGPQQQQAVERLLVENASWLAHLEEAHAHARLEVLEAERAQPYDETRLGWAVARQAETAAYLWGNESRLVASILQLLEPEQQRVFAERRSRAIVEW